MQNELIQLLQSFHINKDTSLLSEALNLVNNLSIDLSGSDAEQKLERIQKLRSYFEVFNAIKAELIPEFDFTQLPPMSTSPPPVTGLPSGVDPENITDPVLKAEYESSIFKDQNKRQRFAMQKALVRIRRKTIQNIEEFFNNVYSDFNLAKNELTDLSGLGLDIKIKYKQGLWRWIEK